MIQGSRYAHLLEAVEGMSRSGKDLVAFNGHAFVAAGSRDDLGLYWLIPRLVKWLPLSVTSAIEVWFWTLFVGSVLFALLGIGKLFQRLRERVVAYIFLGSFAVFLITTRQLIDDIYLISALVSLALIPWGLWFWKTSQSRRRWMYFALISGMVVSVANILRSQAGIPTLTLIGMLLWLQRERWKQKVILTMVFILGVIIPLVPLRQALVARDDFLKKQERTYQSSPARHIVWHTAYIGFGFLSNPYGIEYNDEVALKKVASIDTKVPYLSYDYERILKRETLTLIRAQPFFAFTTWTAKGGVILSYVIIFANLGLIAWWFRVKDWRMEIAFFAAILASTLTGFVAVPWFGYLLGLMSVAMWYGVYSINSAIAQRRTSSS